MLSNFNSELAKRKVLFFPRYDRLGASSRYRFFQYEPHLTNAGFECYFAPLITNAMIRSRYANKRRGIFEMLRRYISRTYDSLNVGKDAICVLQGELLPFVPPFLEALLRMRSIPYIVDFDDAIFHYYDRSTSLLIRSLYGTKIKKIVKNASVVVAGNQYLANYAAEAGAQRVEIIPTVVDLPKYQDIERKPKLNDGKFKIGWIGSPGSSRYLAIVKDSLFELVNKHGFCVTLVGAGTDHELNEIAPELKEWTEETEVEDIANFDVGIMPLPNDDWARGKCGFKLIQYMAAGVPVVASPVGVNQEIVQHGTTGFLAKSTDDWIDSILRIKNSRTTREILSQNGKQLVKDEYCLSATGPRWIDILSHVRQ